MNNANKSAVLGAAPEGARDQASAARAATRNSVGRGLHWVEADALNLPFPNAHFDLVTAAFGFRNLADYNAGLRELLRILRPGGEFGILDFGEPKGAMGKMYRIYFKHVLPAVGTAISGVEGPYKYLPASVARFPEPQEMLDRMRSAGFLDSLYDGYCGALSREEVMLAGRPASEQPPVPPGLAWVQRTNRRTHPQPCNE